jgi:hypothetical protein
MYKVIGADQKEYGPISADQVRQWITEGRINSQTPIQAEGESGWKPISIVPEFAASFPGGPTPPPPMRGVVSSGTGSFNDLNGPAAAQKVIGPAIGLIVTASLGILFGLFRLVLNLVGAGLSTMNSIPGADQNPEVQRMAVLLGGAVGAVVFIITILLWGFVLYGALKMKKLESFGVCVAASIIAMIPCTCPCCLLGLPMGIWALVVLNQPDVRPHFN